MMVMKKQGSSPGIEETPQFQVTNAVNPMPNFSLGVNPTDKPGLISSARRAMQEQ